MLRRQSTTAVAGATGLILAILGVLTAGKRPISSASVSPFRSHLVASLQSIRVTEGRLSGGFAYAPIGTSRAGIGRSQTLSEIARVIEKKAREFPGDRSLEDLALLRLLDGFPEKAVPLLEQAAVLSGQDPSIQNDLTAAYIARYQKQGTPFDLVLALAAADRAIQVAPSLPETLFNRALALEHLFLLPEAAGAWDQYITIEKDADWLREGRQHFAELNQASAGERWEKIRKNLDNSLLGSSPPNLGPVVREFPQAARIYGEEILLAHWAEAFLDGRQSEADRSLALARGIGDLISLNGDQMLQDAVGEISRVLASGDRSARLQALARGHREFGRGLYALASHDSQGAIPHFEKASQALAKMRSPFHFWADCYIGTALYFSSRYDEALEVFDQLVDKVPESQYKSLAGRVHWGIGLAHSLKSQMASAQPNYQQALALYEAIGEKENAAFIHYLLSENLVDLGRRDEAWIELYQSLSARPYIVNPTRLHNILFTFADAALRADEPTIALYFDDEMVSLAKSLKDPLAISEALLRRSRTLQRLDRRVSVLADFMEARRYAKQVHPDSIRERLEADSLLTEGELTSLGNPAESVSFLTGALQAYIERGYYPKRIELYRQRARAFRALGNLDAAEEDLNTALDEIERERKGLPEGEFRESYLNEARSAYDEMISFQFADRGNKLEAFDISERARARALLDLFPGSGVRKPLTAPEIQARIPGNVVLIEYVALADRVLCWVIRRDHVDAVETPVVYTELSRKIAHLRRSLAGHRDERESLRELSWLHKILMDPIVSLLPPGSDLVLLPDKVLYELPFSALYDVHSRHFLIERFTISLCPSGTILVDLLERSGRKSNTRNIHALIIGDPAFIRSIFPQLPRLPVAAAESRRIAALYPRANLLLGADATERNFLSLAQGASVIHIGGHNIENDRGDLSMLLLAPDQRHGLEGLESARSISQLHFSRAPLVVLAGCNTAVGRVENGEGSMSMARAFLAAGASGVLGSFGVFSDTDYSDLLLEFHRQIVSGVPGARAIRNAEVLALLQPGNRSRTEMASMFQFTGAPD